jgi:hypothetical protein
MSKTSYKTEHSYEEIQKISSVANFNYEDKSEVVGLIILGIVKEYSATTVLSLSLLTGLELNTKEKLFNYLKSNISLTDEDIAKLAFTILLSIDGLPDYVKEELDGLDIR